MNEQEQLESAVKKIGIGTIQRHVLFCLGPKCCDERDGEKAWEALKEEIKDAGLARTCARTKAGCLRICCQGPTMVVYPEGTWYRDMTADRIKRFVKEHLVEGKPIEEWIFARNPLPG